MYVFNCNIVTEINKTNDIDFYTKLWNILYQIKFEKSDIEKSIKQYLDGENDFIL